MDLEASALSGSQLGTNPHSLQFTGIACLSPGKPAAGSDELLALSASSTGLAAAQGRPYHVQQTTRLSPVGARFLIDEADERAQVPATLVRDGLLVLSREPLQGREARHTVPD
jgi:hypothetical protein